MSQRGVRTASCQGARVAVFVDSWPDARGAKRCCAAWRVMPRRLPIADQLWPDWRALVTAAARGVLGCDHLVVGLGDPDQDVGRGGGWQRHGGLSLAERGASGLTRRAQHDAAVANHGGEAAARSEGRVGDVVAAHRGVNGSLTLGGAHETFRCAGGGRGSRVGGCLALTSSSSWSLRVRMSRRSWAGLSCRYWRVSAVLTFVLTSGWPAPVGRGCARCRTS